MINLSFHRRFCRGFSSGKIKTVREWFCPNMWKINYDSNSVENGIRVFFSFWKNIKIICPIFPVVILVFFCFYTRKEIISMNEFWRNENKAKRSTIKELVFKIPRYLYQTRSLENVLRAKTFSFIYYIIITNDIS